MKWIILILVLFLVGCASEEVMENKIEQEAGGDADVDIDGKNFKMTGTTDEGSYEIEGSNIGEGWCQEGAEWKYTADMRDTNAQWIVEGLETSGEFNGLCHVLYTFEGDSTIGNIDYYFSEDGKNGYTVMEVNGQKYTSEWHG